MRFKRGEGWKNRKGQVTIFIIIAVVIVAIAVLLYLFVPSIKTTLGVQQQNPRAFMQTCMEKDIKDNLDTISLHGGDINPTFYSTFDNIKIKNLCYATLYCTLCTVQEPQLQSHIEQQIKNNLQNTVDDCLNSMKDNYEKQGYTVNLQTGPFEFSLLPNKAVAIINSSLTLTKTSTEKYDSFNVVVNNNLYELVALANNIIQWETTYGSVDVALYMNLYSNLKVEKKLLSDNTKIYIITDRDTKDMFEFASRSYALSPAGYC
ncbi:MAG TPA: hypothetical protein VMC07_00040 [Candidatus Omnitrophota bacterium]|nr:hypothetical protein [Candidatus Omnitrophota bacterium]